MASSETVLTYFASCWPERKITAQMIEKPTTEFLVSVYTDFLADIKEHMSTLINQDIPDEVNIAHDFPIEVQIFCSMSKFFKRMNIPFCLNDIYQPGPKRTVNCLAVAMHYLCYVNSIQESTAELLGQVFDEADRQDTLKVEKDAAKEKLNGIAEEITRAKDTRLRLLHENKVCTQQHKEMLAAKAARINSLSLLNAKMKHCQLKLEDSENNATKAEQEKSNLETMLVSEDEIRKLKNVEEGLKNELDQFASVNLDLNSGLVSEKELIKHFDQCLDLLKSLDYNKCGESNLSELDTNEVMLKSIEVDRQLVDDSVAKTLKEIKTLKENYVLLMKESKLVNANLKKSKTKLKQEVGTLSQDCQSMKKDVKAKLQYYNEVLEAISRQNAAAHGMANDEKLLQETFQANYKNILDKFRNSVNGFSAYLEHLKQRANC